MRKRFTGSFLLIGVFSLVVLTGASSAFAQATPQTQENAAPKHFVTIYSLKHQTAQNLVPTISQFAGANTIGGNADTPRIAVDQQTNSLIVSANEKTHELISMLLKTLDVEAPAKTKNIPETRDIMIRVVWLVDERLIEGDSNGTAIPPDLLPTVEKLRKKFGLEPLATAGQIIINQRNIGQTEFEGSGTALIQGESKLNVMGRVILGNDQIAELQLIVQIASERNDVQGKIQQQLQGRGKNDSICQLSSKISVSMGRPVFFGMSPIESKASLFVVQVLDANSVADETPRSEK